jgi:hemoglobin
MQHPLKSIYEQVGEAAFERLIAAFYRGVQADPILKPLYPEHDMIGAERRLRLFLIQYFGGPTTYSNERGHPRLRARHMPFTIRAAERDAWLRTMSAALDEAAIPEPARSEMQKYFEMAADFMINASDSPGAPESGGIVRGLRP